MARNIKKDDGEYTANLELYDDIEYMAMACTDEVESVFKALNENYLNNIKFKCNPEEYKQKIYECKELCDWLVNNIIIEINM